MDHDDVLTIVGATGAALAVISVGIRFYARRMKKATIGFDDWFILLSVLSVIATDALIVYANSIHPNSAEVASNKDPNYVYTATDIVYTRLSWICTILYFTIVSTTKLSILLMYNRLFSISRTFRKQILGLSVLVTCFWIGTTLSNILNCIPMKYTWINSHADPRYCINYNLYWFGCGVAECIIDVLILLMPIRIVHGLNLNNTRRIAVAAVFLLGIFVIVSGLVKVIFSYVPGSRQPDFSRTALWTTVHCCTGIICACLPICWPVFVWLTHFRGTTWSRSSSVRKHWYSASGWSVVPGSQTTGRSQRSGNRKLERSAATVERTYSVAGMEAYELPILSGSNSRLVAPFNQRSQEEHQGDYEQAPCKTGQRARVSSA